MRQQEDMATIAAQQYYVDYGLDLTLERLASLLPSYLPDSYIGIQKDVNFWIQVRRARSNTYSSNGNCFLIIYVQGWPKK